MANGYFERGEIYWVKMGSGVGVEMNVTRPGLILSCDDLNAKSQSVLVAFLTTKEHKGGWNSVATDATGRESWVLCDQIQTVDKTRFTKLLGVMNSAEMRNIEGCLEQVFDLGYQDDEALKAKDAEIEARNAVIAEKDAEIQSLRDRMKNQEEANADELTSLRMEITMWTRLYNKAMDQIVDMKFAGDMTLRCRAPKEESEVPPVAVAEVAVAEDVVVPETPVAPETPVEVEQPEVEKVDINTCTMTALKKLGFSLPMAKKIKEARPFTGVEDLKRVNGLKASLYRVVEPKLCCSPVEVEETPAVEVVETPVNKDPGFEPVDINTAAGKDLVAIGFTPSPAYAITSYRKRNGPFRSVDDLRKVPISQKMLDKFRDFLTVNVVEDEEETAPAEESEKLNVNEATVTELMGVGFTKAAANKIVAYRCNNGPYREVYDLMKIPDVTGKTLRKLGDRVRV